MKLWLDDIRDPKDHVSDPENWTWVQNTDAAINALKKGVVTEASLDHDLGSEDTHVGYRVVCWMEEHNVWPPNGVKVHSANPVGKQRMELVIKTAYERIRRIADELG